MLTCALQRQAQLGGGRGVEVQPRQRAVFAGMFHPLRPPKFFRSIDAPFRTGSREAAARSHAALPGCTGYAAATHRSRSVSSGRPSSCQLSMCLQHCLLLLAFTCHLIIVCLLQHLAPRMAPCPIPLAGMRCLAKHPAPASSAIWTQSAAHLPCSTTFTSTFYCCSPRGTATSIGRDRTPATSLPLVSPTARVALPHCDPHCCSFSRTSLPSIFRG